MDYLRQGAMANSDAMLVAEHHRSGEGLHQQVKALRKMGWTVTAEAAASTGTAQVREGRGHGGVWVGVRTSLESHGLGREAKQAVQSPEHAGSSTQWAARTLRVRGHDITLVSVYLAVGLGLQGQNVVVLQEIGTYLKTLGTAFIVMGDFNMTIEELEPLEMETFLGARWLNPASPSHGGHRQIDLVLISVELAVGAKVDWDLEGPWAQPHVGLILQVEAQVLGMTAQKMMAPAGVDVAYGPDKPWDH